MDKLSQKKKKKNKEKGRERELWGRRRLEQVRLSPIYSEKAHRTDQIRDLGGRERRGRSDDPDQRIERKREVLVLFYLFILFIYTFFKALSCLGHTAMLRPCPGHT